MVRRTRPREPGKEPGRWIRRFAEVRQGAATREGYCYQHVQAINGSRNGPIAGEGAWATRLLVSTSPYAVG